MVIGAKARLPTRIPGNAIPPSTPFLGFMLNIFLPSSKCLPEQFLHNAMNGPCAQARRIKDIGRVLLKYYGLHRNTERKEGAELFYCRWKKGGIIYGNNIVDSRKSKGSPSNVL